MTVEVVHRVRQAGPRDRRWVVDVLVGAFGDDPLFELLVPPGSRMRASRLRRAFALEVARSWRRGGTWVTDDRSGVLVCFPPGKWESTWWEDAWGALQWRFVFGRNLGVALSAISRMEAVQRALPEHWFLCYAAVDPTCRARGVASALASAVLTECDRTGRSAYFEASGTVSCTAARRYGFVAGEPLLLADDGPSVVPMWREPADTLVRPGRTAASVIGRGPSGRAARVGVPD